MNSVTDIPEGMSYLIRKSPDQGVFATPRGLSQLTTSFVGNQCQGIHHILSFTSYINLHLDEIMCFIFRTICQRAFIKKQSTVRKTNG